MKHGIFFCGSERCWSEKLGEMDKMTVKEAIEGFKMDNALLAGKEDAVVERNNMAIAAIERFSLLEGNKNQDGNNMKIELLRNNDWFKLKPLLEKCGYTVVDVGNDGAIVTYSIRGKS